MLAITLQPRDFQLFVGLLDSRIMSLTHAADLYFGGNRETAKKRVQKLKAAGYVGERAKLPGDPSILYITKKAFLALQAASMLPNRGKHLTWEFLQDRPRVSDLTLRHELAVMDIKAAFHAAVAFFPAWKVEEFTTWPLFYSFKANPSPFKERLMKPDGYLRLSEEIAAGKEELTFFLEVDRSTEVQKILQGKAACYRNYYQSGAYAQRMGGSSQTPQDFPFRVLLIVLNEERRNNAMETLLHATPPILSLVWVATREAALANPLGPIWMRPVDYRDALRDSAFDPQKRIWSLGYRRQSEREIFVNERTPLHSLFTA